MYRVSILLVFIFLYSLFTSTLCLAWAPAVVPPEYLAAVQKEWKPLYEKHGIKVFERLPQTGEGPMAFRGIGIIKASPMKVLCLLRHVDSSAKWTPNLHEKKVLKEYSYLDAVTYNRNKLPWPATDRDTVLRSTLTVDKENRYIIVVSYSVEHPAAPPFKDTVRGILYHSNFIFKPVEGGGTFVDIDAHFDPKGNIPRWLVNFVQKDWVYNFLSRLEKEAQVTTLPDQSAFQEVLNELAALEEAKNEKKITDNNKK